MVPSHDPHIVTDFHDTGTLDTGTTWCHLGTVVPEVYMLFLAHVCGGDSVRSFVFSAGGVGMRSSAFSAGGVGMRSSAFSAVGVVMRSSAFSAGGVGVPLVLLGDCRSLGTKGNSSVGSDCR